MSNDNSFLITRHKLKLTDQKLIEILCKKLPYYYFDDCAYGNFEHELKGDMHPYFSHTLLNEQGEKSEHFRKFPWIPIGEAIGMPNNKMMRAHMTLQYPRPDVFGVAHNSHVDQPNRKHIVALYYPNKSDGDTFFFDSDQNIIHRETPERGKVVVFDGSQYHSSSSPSETTRFTLNINYYP